MESCILINELVDIYLKKFCIYMDVNYTDWEKYIYEIHNKPEEDIFMEIIQDVAKIINNILYQNYHILNCNNKNKVYIINKSGTLVNLISWKYVDNNKIYLRYGINGIVRYIKLVISFERFLLI